MLNQLNLNIKYHKKKLASHVWDKKIWIFSQFWVYIKSYFVVQIFVYDSQQISRVWYLSVAHPKKNLFCVFLSPVRSDLAICVHFAYIFPPKNTLAGSCKHMQTSGSRAVYGRLLLFPLAVTYSSLFWQLRFCVMCCRRQPPAAPTQPPHWTRMPTCERKSTNDKNGLNFH